MGNGGLAHIRGPTVDDKTKVQILKALQWSVQRQQAYHYSCQAPSCCNSFFHGFHSLAGFGNCQSSSSRKEAPISAKLMGVAGGLAALSKTPACNVQLLGSQKRTLSGFSQTAVQPHTGFIFHSPIVQDTPPDLRRKAARLVSSKSALAASVDAFHESGDGGMGRSFRENVDRKLDKLQEPPPVTAIKPLAAPMEAPRMKRGGKRVRRMKEMWKQANRMTFGQIEEDAYQEALQLSSAKLLEQLLQLPSLLCRVEIFSLGGLEIVSPQAAEKKVSEANIRYFSNTSTFLKVTTPLPGLSSSSK